MVVPADRFLAMLRIAAVRSLHELSTASFQDASFSTDRSPRRVITDLPKAGTHEHHFNLPQGMFGRTFAVVRSDNGSIFQSRRFRAACRDYRLSQEFVTPYTPEQNGMIERWFRSLKEKCVWLENFEDFEQAKAAVAGWIRFYNSERPHQSLNYMSPEQFRAQQPQQVA